MENMENCVKDGKFERSLIENEVEGMYNAYLYVVYHCTYIYCIHRTCSTFHITLYCRHHCLYR